MRLPNFLVLGAAKAGTSSLAEYLGQHPQIFLPRGWKELRFFAYEGRAPSYRGPGDAESNARTTSDLAAYARFFEDARDHVAVGEVSPVYLYHHVRAAESIARHLGSPRMVIVLRNPVERAFSHWTQLVRDNREPLGFAAALAAEDERVRNAWEWSWHYVRVGLYAEQVEAYLARFGRERVRIYLYEDLECDPQALLRDLYRFLGVTEDFVADTSVRLNVSGVPKSQLLRRTLLRARATIVRGRERWPRVLWQPLRAHYWRVYNANLVRPTLDPALRRTLAERFRPDVERLARLVDRDLSAWVGEGP